MIFVVILLMALFASYREHKVASNTIAGDFTLRKIPALTTCLFIFMFLVCALRGDSVGKDSENYIIGFNLGFSGRMEYGILLILSICKNIGLQYQWFVIIFALLSLCPLYIAFKRESLNVALSLLAYFSFSNYFYPEAFNTIRATTAVAFFVLSLSFLKERNWKKYICFSLIAILFHNTTIIAIIISWLLMTIKKVSSKSAYVLIVSSFVIGIAFKTGFSEYSDMISLWLGQYSGETADYYALHASLMEEFNYNIIGTLSTMLPFTVFAVLCTNEENSRNIYYQLFLTGVVLSNVFVSVTLSYRITMYFTVLVCVLVPNMISTERGFMQTAGVGLTLVMALWFVYRLFIIQDSMAGINPYEFYFE